MKKLRIYLAGPIDGCTIEEATEWRHEFIDRFSPYVLQHRLAVLNPMAGEEGLVAPGQRVSPENYTPGFVGLVAPSAIFRRDILMIQNCDILYVDLSASLFGIKGTMFEMGLAYGAGKLIVMVCPDERLARHPFVSQSGVVFSSTESACQFIKSILDLDIL